MKKTSELLDDLQKHTGLDIPLHVDGASGGFAAPFLDPDLEWDFRVSRVQSVNVAGHQYGLVCPGGGWALWRDAEGLPEDLIFWVNCLGDNMPPFTLKDDVENFTVFDVSAALRERGWQVPAYTFPKNTEDLAVLRVRGAPRLHDGRGRHAVRGPQKEGQDSREAEGAGLRQGPRRLPSLGPSRKG